MLEARLVGEGYNVPNPIGIASLGDTEDSLFAVLGPILLFAIVLSLASIVVRYRRGSMQERQQLKWIAFAMSVFLVTVALEDAFGVVLPNIVSPLTLMALPVSVAIAVLKYRLYDIDRLISRTLAYGALTALLAGGYLTVVLALQSLLPIQDDSPLIVAISTLAVVAAFGPLRARVQGVVDRRFNRTNYDAQQTVDAFGRRSSGLWAASRKVPEHRGPSLQQEQVRRGARDRDIRGTPARRGRHRDRGVGSRDHGSQHDASSTCLPVASPGSQAMTRALSKRPGLRHQTFPRIRMAFVTICGRNWRKRRLR